MEYVFSSFIGLSSLLLGSVATISAEGSPAVAIEKYIAAERPSYRQLSVDEIDSSSCRNYEEISVSIQEDFDGDGAVDLAFLIVSTGDQAKTRWHDKELTPASLELVVLLAAGSEAQQALTLEQSPSFLPSSIFIRRGGPSTEKQASDDTALGFWDRPGISRVNCEKSEVRYQWTGQDFEIGVLAD